MLLDSFKLAAESKFVKAINKFLYTPYYMSLIAALMAVSNLFAMEFVVFYLYLTFAIYITFLAPDCFPIMPMFCCGYMLFSAGNNPASNYGKNFLSSKENIIQFIIILVLIAILLISRLVYEIVAKKRYKQFSKALTLGFILLGASYLLAGFLSPEYSLRTVIFGAVEIISLCFTYYYFMFTVDWSKRKGSDIALLFCAVGIGLALQIIGMYLRPEAFEALKNGTFNRGMLISGWGIYNNVGGMMAMMIPAPFYLATTRKNQPWWILLGCVFMIAVMLTQSRGSMLSGAGVFVLCILLTIICSKGENRRKNVMTIAILAFAALTVLACTFDILMDKVFRSFKNMDFFNSSGRWDIYKYGIDRFAENPIFGNGFYVGEDVIYQHGSTTLPDKAFLPPRYHNTYVQLLASGGIVSMLAYLFHRFQTLLLTFKNRNVFKMFFILPVAAVVFSSVVDCHFFNLGPGLTYGVVLVCMEKIVESADKNVVEI